MLLKKEMKTMVELEVEQRLESSFADFVYVSWSRDGTMLYVGDCSVAKIW